MSAFRDFYTCPLIIRLDRCSAVEDVVAATAMADTLPHWFDRQRAARAIAKRMDVDPEMVFRLMRGGL